MSLLIQLTIILAFALVLVPLTKRLGLPTLIGYVVTGILLGPYVLNLIPLSIELKQLQHLGLLLLLFLVGMQLQTERLSQLAQVEIKLSLYAVGLLSSLLMLLGVGLLDLSVSVSLILSLTLSLVSFSLLQQQIGVAQSFSMGLARKLFNFALIHALLASIAISCMPLLTGLDSPQHHLAYVMSVVAAMSGLFLLQRYILQPVFEFLEKTQTNELILASAVFTASLSFIALDAFGIHDTLAALLAGFLISDSRFHQRLAQYILPFKGLVFAAFFLVLGMSLPLQLLIEQPVFLGFGLLILLILKVMIYLGLSRYFKATWQDSTLTSVTMFSTGEFGFILLYLAFQNQIATANILEPYLMLLMLSFLFSPAVLYMTQRYVLPRCKAPATDQSTLFTTQPLLIIGFGRVGQLVARIAHLHQLPFTAIDSNVSDQHNLSTYGGRLITLDATDFEQLAQLNLNAAKLAVIAIDDVEDNINIVRYLQLHHPDLKLLVRARDRHHSHLLRDLGIEQIWRETYLSALELATVSVQVLGIEREIAEHNVQAFRIHDQILQRQQQQIEYDDTKLYQTQDAAFNELYYLFNEDRKFKTTLPREASSDLEQCAALQQMKANDL